MPQIYALSDFDALLQSPGLAAIRSNAQFLRDAFYKRASSTAEYDVRYREGMVFAMQAMQQIPPETQPPALAVLYDLCEAPLDFTVLEEGTRFFVLLSCVDFIGEQPDPRQLANILCNLAVMRPMLVPGGISHAVNDIFYYINSPMLSYRIVAQRCFGLLQCLQTCVERVAPLVPKPFLLSPTGSDGHLGNQQAIFIYGGNSRTPTHVYKPHPMMSDWIYNNFIRTVNANLPQNLAHLALPYLEIIKGDTWGLEPFATTCPPSDVRTYYTQMGMLAFLLKYIGMEDAHQDNILPARHGGLSGPLLIDAECCCSSKVLLSTSLGATCLGDALTKAIAPRGKTASAVFSIQGKPSNSLWREYLADLSHGYQIMAQLMRDTNFANAVSKFALACYNGLTFVRVVPVATNVFQELITKDYSTPQAMLVQNPFGSTLLNSLSSFMGAPLTPAQQAFFYQIIKASFDIGDVPYFYFRYEGAQGWWLYCDSTRLVQRSPLLPNPGGVFQTNLNDLLAQDTFQDFIAELN